MGRSLPASMARAFELVRAAPFAVVCAGAADDHFQRRLRRPPDRQPAGSAVIVCRLGHVNEVTIAILPGAIGRHHAPTNKRPARELTRTGQGRMAVRRTLPGRTIRVSSGRSPAPAPCAEYWHSRAGRPERPPPCRCLCRCRANPGRPRSRTGWSGSCR